MSKNKYTSRKQTPDFNSSLRKDFFRRLLYIVLCAIPLWMLADEKPPLSYLALVFFLFGMYQFMLIVSLSQMTVDAFFPPVNLFEAKTKRFDKFVYYFCSVFFFISMVCLLFELRTLDNTINGISLFWKSGCLGIGAALLITFILKKTNPSVYFESKRRYTIHFGLFVGGFLFAAAAGSFINHYFASPTVMAKELIIKRKSTGGRRNTSNWLFLPTRPSSDERFEVTDSFYETVEEGQTILLDVKEGKLGYEVIVGFRKRKAN